MGYGPVKTPDRSRLKEMSLTVIKENIMALADGIEEHDAKIIEINSALDAREREILDLYARIEALESRLDSDN